MTGPTLTLSGVAFAYPGSPFRLTDIELTVAPGELVAVIGASGCGKSTVLKLVAGFLAPLRGRVLVDGMDVTAMPPRARNLGVVFQAYALFPHMTAWENVAYPLKVRGVGIAERRQISLNALVQEALAAVSKAEEEARLYEEFNLLGEHPEECDVEFMMHAAWEVVRRDDP